MQKTALSVDFGGSKIIVGLVAHSGAIIALSQNAIPPDERQRSIQKAVDMCRELLDANKNIHPDVIGINIPGIADAQNGVWIEACFSNISNVRIAELFGQEFGLPAFAANDINNCALAESVYGICADVPDFAWLTLSNGCGGALFFDGKVYTGAFGAAGEFGHIAVEYEHPEECPCGQLGCLEAHASGPAIVRSYGRKAGAAAATAKEVAQYAREGDRHAISVFREEGMYVGRAIAAVVNIINPPVFVLGGGISAAWELFYPEMMKTIKQHIYIKPNESFRVARTGLSYYAALVGAAAFAFYRLGQA